MENNPLMNLLSQLMDNGGSTPTFEPIAPLSEKDNREWEKINSDLEKTRSKLSELEAKKKIFWIKLERKLEIYDRNLMVEGGMVLAEKENKNNCEVPGQRLSIPDFCDGDCDNCALNPEEDEEENENGL